MSAKDLNEKIEPVFQEMKEEIRKVNLEYQREYEGIENITCHFNCLLKAFTRDMVKATSHGRGKIHILSRFPGQNKTE